MASLQLHPLSVIAKTANVALSPTRRRRFERAPELVMASPRLRGVTWRLLCHKLDRCNPEHPTKGRHDSTSPLEYYAA
jgi:hypothetical protein